MPVPEADFFGIVIAIQQKTGGNLSEALGNLSKVLRDRKKRREDQGDVDGGQGVRRHHRRAAAVVMAVVYISSPDTFPCYGPSGSVS